MQPYTFDDYLSRLSDNWFEDDPLLIACLERYVGPAWRTRAEAFGSLGARLPGELDRLARRAARPENLPRLEPYDGYGRRVDTVAIAPETEKLLAAFYEARPYRAEEWELYTRMFLFAQLGEAGTLCSAVCTDGMVRALRALARTPPLRAMLDQLLDGGHAAQFVTEIQGGCDVARNRVEAVPENGAFRLYGQKWFCSNIIADCFAVTARPRGSERVALFAVPAWRDGKRNGYRIERLKEKLGTENLPTAEVMFDGALAFPLGPLDSGIATLLRHVISTSRFGCALGSAGYLTRVARELELYADFRETFGRSIRSYPVVAAEIAAIRAEARRMLAGCWRLWNLWRKVSGGEATRDEGHRLRVMMMLMKMHASRSASLMLHRALMLYGANGIDRGFSPASTFLRDAVINEIWEGPHTLMLANALRDLARGSGAPDASPARFVAACVPADAAAALTEELEAILPSEDPARSLRFADWAPKLVSGYQQRALAEVEAGRGAKLGGD